MSVLAIYPAHNSEGKRDVTGAFRPAARAFAKLHGGHAASFDNRASKKKRRAEVEELVWAMGAESTQLHALAICCHGTKRGLQTGHSTTAHLEELAWTIARVSEYSVRVVLYACSTAAVRGEDERRHVGPGGDGGPADRLRDAMSTEGCVGGAVDGHSVVGHATKAPYVRRFHTVGNRTGEKVDVTGGDWLVAPGSPEWRNWVRALQGRREPKDIRYRFPLMSVQEVRAAVA